MSALILQRYTTETTCWPPSLVPFQWPSWLPSARTSSTRTRI